MTTPFRAAGGDFGTALTDELGISKNVASSRFHREYSDLAENTLTHDE